MDNISLKMARMESLLIENKKFAKQWLKNLKKHQHDCPCKLNGYTNIKICNNSDGKNNDKPCPFNLRQYGKSCFSCDFAEILHARVLRHFHLRYILKGVIKSWTNKN